MFGIRLNLSICLAFALLFPVFGTVGVAATSSSATGIESEVAVEGQSLKLEAEVGGGDAPFSYQWFKDGAPVAGATQRRFEIAEVRPSDAGVYAVVVSNPGGSAASLPYLLSVSSARPSRLANISIVTTADEPVVVGFTLGGGGEAELARLLVRAAGPALTQFGVAAVLPDPLLEIGGAGGGILTFNDNWGGGIDLAATAMLRKLHAEVERRGARLAVIGAHGAVRDLLRREGFADLVGDIGRASTLEAVLDNTPAMRP